MAAAEIKETLEVDKDKLFDTIVKYEDYPEFVTGCSKAKVESRGDGKARVTYLVSLMKEVSYTLDLTEDRAKGTVEWSLVKSDFMSKNSGRWELKSEPGMARPEAQFRF